MDDPNRDVRHVFPGSLEEIEAYDRSVDIDACANALRNTLHYSRWRCGRSLQVFFLTALPFLQRAFPGVSIDKDWRD